MSNDKTTITTDPDTQILKCRDDKTPVYFTTITEPSRSAEPFKFSEGYECAWGKKDECFGSAELLKSRWTGKDVDGMSVERKADWKPIADNWQGKNT